MLKYIYVIPFFPLNLAYLVNKLQISFRGQHFILKVNIHCFQDHDQKQTDDFISDIKKGQKDDSLVMSILECLLNEPVLLNFNFSKVDYPYDGWSALSCNKTVPLDYGFHYLFCAVSFNLVY